MEEKRIVRQKFKKIYQKNWYFLRDAFIRIRVFWRFVFASKSRK